MNGWVVSWGGEGKRGAVGGQGRCNGFPKRKLCIFCFINSGTQNLKNENFIALFSEIRITCLDYRQLPSPHRPAPPPPATLPQLTPQISICFLLCTAVLPYCWLHFPTAILPHCCTKHCYTAVLLYCHSALLPYCSSAILLYCHTANFTHIAILQWAHNVESTLNQLDSTS